MNKININAEATVIVSGEAKATSRNHNLFSPEQEQDIVNLYQQGKSLSQIQKVYQCSNWTTICNVLKRHNIPRRRRGNVVREVTQQEMDQIKGQWEEGLSVLAISKGLDISYEKLRTWMIANGFRR